MNNNPRFIKNRLGQFIAATVLAGITSGAYAGNFSFTSNTINVPGHSGGNLFIDSDGIADSAELPTGSTFSSGSFNVSFGLTASDAPNGDYFVRVRMNINSQTKTNNILNMILGVVKVTVSGGAVTGAAMVTTGQPNYGSISVSGSKQNGTSALNVSSTFATGTNMLSSSGSTLTVRIDNIFSRLTGENALFDDIIGGFIVADHYNYSISVEPVGGTSLVLGYRDGGTFTRFQRLINCSAYTVRGTMTIGSPSATLVEPVAQTDSCDAPPETGGGTTPPPPGPITEPPPAVDQAALDAAQAALEAIQNQLNNLPTEGPVSTEILDSIATAFQNSSNVADSLLQVVTNVQPGETPPQLNVGNTLTSLLSVTGTVVSGSTVATRTEGTTSNELINQNLNLVSTTATVMAALVESTGTQGLSQQQQTQVRDITSNLVNSMNSLATTATTPAALDQLAQNTAAALEAQKRLNVPATPAQVEALVDVSIKLATARLTQILTEGNAGAPAPTEEQVRQALASDSSLLERVVASALPIPPTTTRSTAERAQAVNNIAASAGIELSEAARNRAAQATTANVNPADVQVGGQSVLSLLQNLFSSNLVQLSFIDDNGRVGNTVAVTDASQTITVDAATGTVVVRLPTETYTGVIVAVRAVPNTVPNGITFRRDGRGMIVTNGVAVELATTAANYLGFIGALENLGYAYTQRTDASFSLNIGGGQRFVGAFAYNNLTGKNLDTCGAVSFDTPTGAVNSPNYSFKAKCANGIEQNILPFPSNANFYNSVAAAGLTVNTDRNTGIITISGVGRVKPSFFVSTPTTAETAYHTANKDANDLAFQATDVNGDGIVDYKVISATGVQVMFGIR